MKDIRVPPFVKELIRIWSKAQPVQLAAALAFYGMFSFAPLAYFAFRVAGFFLDRAAVRDEVYVRLANTLGQETTNYIEDVVAQVASNTSQNTPLVTVVTVVALLFAASGVFAQLQYALDVIWEVPAASYRGLLSTIRNRLLAFVAVICLGLLLVFATSLTSVISLLDTFLDLGSRVPGASLVVSIGVTTLVFALIYKTLPSVPPAWRDVWIGSLVTSLLFNIGRILIGFYLTHSNLLTAFAAAGALAVILSAIYYLALVFLFGAVFTRAYAATYGAHKTG